MKLFVHLPTVVELASSALNIITVAWTVRRPKFVRKAPPADLKLPMLYLYHFSSTCHKHIALMLLAWRPSVHVSVTLMECDHIITQCNIKWKWAWKDVDVLATGVMPKPTWIVISRDFEFYWGWPVIYWKCGVLLFGGNNLCVQQLACRAVSAFIELLSWQLTCNWYW